MKTINMYIYNGNADLLFSDLMKFLLKGEDINLSYKNTNVITLNFLHTAIGQLYKYFNNDYIKEHLTISEATQSQLYFLKRVVDTAKEYYSEEKEKKTNDTK